MSNVGVSTNVHTTLLGRVHAIKETHAFSHWSNSYTVWAYAEEARICEWAHELVADLEQRLKRKGFVFAYDTHRMTRAILYWCWGLKKTLSVPQPFGVEIPFPGPCADSSNDPYEYELYNSKFEYRYWMDFETAWRPDYMNDEFSTHFFTNLGLFCWHHLHAEQSPLIRKERDAQAAEEEDGSADEWRTGDHGSYFKGKKEYY
jgi:hypothetical protein